jgi:MFS family permease
VGRTGEEVVAMYGLTRATLTLIGAAAAGVLLWLATTILPDDLADASQGGYWAAFGLVALGGLAMALSQLLGGWTKWGWPRVSSHVFLVGFLPTLVVGGWMLAAHEPENYWLGRHVRSWSDDLGIEGLVGDLGLMIPAIAFGIGLVFGLTFDTTGPRIPRRMKPVPAAGAHPRRTGDGDGTADGDRRVRLEDDDAPTASQPEPEPRPVEPVKK